MNVLIITQFLSGGGAEKVAANLSLGLSKTNNVYVLTYNSTNDEYNYAGTRLNIDSDASSFWGRLYQSIRRVFLLIKIKNRYNIEKSISFVPQCDYPNVISSFFAKSDSIVEVSSNMSVAFPPGLKKKFRHYILSKASKIAVVSNGSRIDLINNWKLPTNKITTIYNSIDIGYIESALMQENDIKIDGEYIIAMGSFRKPKGHWHLIKAFSIVKKYLPNLKLIILGDGPYKADYIKLINIFDLEESILMPGFVSNPFIYIANSAFMVFPSIYEGFGNAIIEAMICGVPVISTDCDYGPREILAPSTNPLYKTSDIEYAKYGILIPSFDMSDIDVTTYICEKEKMLASAIIKLYNNYKMRRQYISKTAYYYRTFSNENFTQEWLSLLKKG